MPSSSKRSLYIIVCATILVKVLLLPFSETVDADAVSRIHLAMRWLDSPHWISTAVWGPFHTYLNAFALYIYDDPIIAPKVLNILFSALTLLPIHAWVDRIAGRRAAWIAVILFACCPILFRGSLMALSETPYLFFLALSLERLSAHLLDGKASILVVSGLALTLAAGLRYEAWALILLFTLLLWRFSSFRSALIFGAISMLFPIIWMLSNWSVTGDVLHSIHANGEWIAQAAYGEGLDFEGHLRTLWFFPFSWFIALGPLVVLALIRWLKNGNAGRPSLRPSTMFWMIALSVFTFLLLFNAVTTRLMLHHRFIGTAVLLSLPMATLALDRYVIRRKWHLIALPILTLLLSYGYNMGSIRPIPRLEDRTVADAATVLRSELGENEALIIDQIDFETTYFLALRSGLHPDRVYIQDGSRHQLVDTAAIRRLLLDYPSAIHVEAPGSDVHRLLLELDKGDPSTLDTETLYTTERFGLKRSRR